MLTKPYFPITRKEPEPKKTVDKPSYDKGHNDGWNACMSYLKAVGKI